MDGRPVHEFSRVSKMNRYIILGLVLVLIVLHQDFWFWTDDRRVWGFLPIGLFYHACLSVGATLVWLLATKIAWPTELIDEVASEAEGSDSGVKG